MTLTLELSHAQEALLKQRAAEAGQEPAHYLLTAAGIAPSLAVEPETKSDTKSPENGSAYDLFEGLIGGFTSGRTNLSENTGAAFAEGMAEKRRNGHL